MPNVPWSTHINTKSGEHDQQWNQMTARDKDEICMGKSFQHDTDPRIPRQISAILSRLYQINSSSRFSVSRASIRRSQPNILIMRMTFTAITKISTALSALWRSKVYLRWHFAREHQPGNGSSGSASLEYFQFVETYLFHFLNLILLHQLRQETK